MDGRYISEDGNTITINTTAAPAFEVFGKESYLGGRVAIEEVDLDGSPVARPLYSESKIVFRIELDRSLEENKDLSFNLICRNDEYFYSIQEAYATLLENEDINNLDLLAILSPRLELLVQKTEGETHVSQLTKAQIKHLLNRTGEEEEKLAKRFEGSSLESSHDVGEIEKSIKNRFFIVLNKFGNGQAAQSSIETEFLEFDGGGFREPKDGEVPELPGPGQRLAIIVHGLASRIGEAYHDLAQHLETAGYHVFGFDYLTINQPISVSSRQLAENIKRLKKKYPESEVLIVAHSMGGLVARSAEVAHGAEIDQLVMAGTPNSGSLLVNSPNLIRSIFLLGGLFEIIPIKFEDYRQLIVSKELLGLKDLSNRSGFISELNAKDRMHYSKKYFSLVGRYEGLSNDIIVHSENMTEINGTNMPSIPLEKHHFEYFRGAGWYEPLDKALWYLK